MFIQTQANLSLRDLPDLSQYSARAIQAKYVRLQAESRTLPAKPKRPADRFLDEQRRKLNERLNRAKSSTDKTFLEEQRRKLNNRMLRSRAEDACKHLPPAALAADKDPFLTAIHESGHAFVAAVQDRHIVDYVSVIPDDERAGVTVIWLSGVTPRQQAMIVMAGPVAESFWQGNIQWGPFANGFGELCDLGMIHSLGYELDGEAFNALRDDVVYPLIKKHWSCICEIASALMSKKRLSGADLGAIVDPYLAEQYRAAG